MLIIQHTAPCTLHSVHYTPHLHLQMTLNLTMYTLYYTLKAVQCTPQSYTEFGKFITFLLQQSKFACVGLKIFIAKCTFISGESTLPILPNQEGQYLKYSF